MRAEWIKYVTPAERQTIMHEQDDPKVIDVYAMNHPLFDQYVGFDKGMSSTAELALLLLKNMDEALESHPVYDLYKQLKREVWQWAKSAKAVTEKGTGSQAR